MKYTLQTLAFLSLLLPFTGTPYAMDQEAACLDVNNAYIAGRSTNRFSVRQVGIMPKGESKFLRELKLNGGSAIQRDNGAKRWEETDSGWTLDGGTYTKFSSCAPSSLKGKKGEKIYDFVWKSPPFEGNGTMWISQNGKMTKMSRERISPSWFAPTDKVVDIYDYNPKHAFIPDACKRGCAIVPSSPLP